MSNVATYFIGTCTILFALSGLAIGKVDANTAYTLIATALIGMGVHAKVGSNQ